MTIIDARVPTRAPGLELLGELRDSGYTESRSIVRRADGQIVQLTSLLYCLLEAVDGERDTVALADELSRSCGKDVAPADVEFLLHERLAPLGLVCDPEGAPPPARKPVPLLALRWKVVVTEPGLTRRITAPFAVLFRKAVVIPVLLAFAVTTWWVLFEHGLASGTRQAFDSPGLLLAAFALILVSAGWHEFGHAAACRAAGATPGAMGAGLYMVWPAFYTDVDDSRRLGRWGRLKVDLGGIYFNAVAAVAVMAVWLVSRVDALLLVVAAQLLLIVRQLAPVIRADGYHILSDLIGVPDLFQHMKPTLAGMLPHRWGKPQPLRPWARWVVRAWVLLVAPLLFLLFLSAVVLFPRLVATAWVGLAQQFEAMTSSGTNVVGVLAGLLKIASLIVPVAALGYMVFRVVRRTARRVWTGTEGRPVARSLVMAVVFLLVMFLAFAWWPAGQYQPVRADEGLTLDHALHVRDAPAPAAAPAPSAEPVPGYALIPRGGDAPALLVVRADDGSLQSIVVDDGAETGLAFPFALPDAPGPGDNQALAVNTTIGGVVYDVAVALVWMTDGEPVENRNEAYALASCSFCRTVAVSFQVVLVVGQTDVIAPVNIAAAANGGCLACQTAALAVQLVVTLNEMPDEELQAELESAMASLDDLDLDDLGAVYDQIAAVESEVLTLLDEAGLVDEAVVNSESVESTTTTTSTTVATTSTTEESTTTTSSTSSTTTSSTTTTSTTSP